MWVNRWKVDGHGRVVKAKLSLVARGFSKCEGIDVSETFAHIVSISCVLLLSAIACERDLDLCHFDVDQTFVQSDLKEDVFYGCRRMWRTFRRGSWTQQTFVRIEASLAYMACSPNDVSQNTKLGFEHCMTDVYVFRLIEDGRVAITTVVHVDDIFAVGQKKRCDSNELT